MDEQALADPVLASNWLALCLASKPVMGILIYGYTNGANPVRRIEIRIEERCNPSVRFDRSLPTISDDLGHLRVYAASSSTRFVIGVRLLIQTRMEFLPATAQAAQKSSMGAAWPEPEASRASLVTSAAPSFSASTI
jgi:hypothetical protein